jgi:hypothetical protein
VSGKLREAPINLKKFGVISLAGLRQVGVKARKLGGLKAGRQKL